MIDKDAVTVALNAALQSYERVEVPPNPGLPDWAGANRPMDLPRKTRPFRG
jgi:hypothetical protein